ncbi:UNKNOWN [Stylonychia lemnae]|uniref:Uncharacterized protein n=1 Tax=Stylonychia lemnae TaxID=5949 RepID=A0A078A9H9_STYLE|nr:UNKNOWN [Stylonychia lemnae]|eukprot:CDW78915.1 UNKNOWN [Stylonychia lemnae]
MLMLLFGFYKGDIVLNKSQPQVSKTSLIQNYKSGGIFRKEISDLGISEYFCLVDNNYQIQGGYYDDIYEYIELKIFKCSNNTESDKCYPREEIDNYFEAETLNFAYINTYIDYKDTNDNSKVKLFIDDSFFVELEASKNKKANFYIQKQQAKIQDDYFQFGQERIEQFFSVSNIERYDDNYSPSLGYISAVYFRYDNRYDIYQIKYYSLLELIGDLGGLYNGLRGVGFMIVAFYTSRMLQSNIIRKIYSIRKGELKREQMKDQKIIYYLKDSKGQMNETLRFHHGIETTKRKSRKQNNEQEQKCDEFQEMFEVINLHGSQSKSEFFNQPDEIQNPISLLHNRRSSIITKNSQVNSKNHDTNSNLNSNSFEAKSELSGTQSQAILPLNQLSEINKRVKIQQLQINDLNQDVSLKDFDKSQKVKEKNISEQLKSVNQLNEDHIDSIMESIINRIRLNYRFRMLVKYYCKCLCLKKLKQITKNEQEKIHYLYQKGRKQLKRELDVVQLLKSLRKFKLMQQALLPDKISRMLLQFQRFNLVETDTSQSDSDEEKEKKKRLMEDKDFNKRLIAYEEMREDLNIFKTKNIGNLEQNLIRGVFQRRLNDNDSNERIDFQESKSITESNQQTSRTENDRSVTSEDEKLNRDEDEEINPKDKIDKSPGVKMINNPNIYNGNFETEMSGDKVFRQSIIKRNQFSNEEDDDIRTQRYFIDDINSGFQNVELNSSESGATGSQTVDNKILYPIQFPSIDLADNEFQADSESQP